MRPATDQFLELVRQSHVIAAACQLVFPDGTTADVPVQAGSVRNDRTADNRRAGTIQIPWSLQAGRDLGVDLRTLSLGGYAVVSRGIRYADGSTELVQLGRLRVESVSWDTLDASASLELADRMAQVRDEPFTAPYAAAGRTHGQACVEIVQAVFGSSIAYHTPYAPTDVIADTIYTGARTDALSDLKLSVGAEVYFDALGDFVFAAKPPATPSPSSGPSTPARPASWSTRKRTLTAPGSTTASSSAGSPTRRNRRSARSRCSMMRPRRSGGADHSDTSPSSPTQRPCRPWSRPRRRRNPS